MVSTESMNNLGRVALFQATVLAALVSLLALTGCGSRAPAAPPTERAMPIGGLAAVNTVRSGEYRIGLGDTLRVRFLFHDQLDSDPEVRQDGHITITALGDFQAYGVTTHELEQDIYRRASLTYRNPQVGVVVTKQSVHRAYVGGEVGRPGYVDLRPGMTALRAIFMTGGFQDTAKVDNVLHVRWADDGTYNAEVLDLRLSSADIVALATARTTAEDVLVAIDGRALVVEALVEWRQP